MYTAGDGPRADREFCAPGAEYTPPGYEFTPAGLKGPESEEKDSRRWLLKRIAAVAMLGIVWASLLAARQAPPVEPVSPPLAMTPEPTAAVTAAEPSPSPTAGPAPTAEPSPTPSATPTATATSTPSPAPTPTSTPTSVAVSIYYQDRSTAPTPAVSSVTDFLSSPPPLQYGIGATYQPPAPETPYYCQGYVVELRDGSYEKLTVTAGSGSTAFQFTEEQLANLPVSADNNSYIVNIYAAWYKTSGSSPSGQSAFALPLRLDWKYISSAYVYNAMAPADSSTKVYLPAFPEPPARSGYQFTGWYDSTGTRVYMLNAQDFFTDPSSGTFTGYDYSYIITLYAGWEPVSTP